MSFQYFFLLFLIFKLGTPAEQSCSNLNTCNECIQAKGCSWCLKPTPSSDNQPKCFPKSSVTRFCANESIEDPPNTVKVTKNLPLTRNAARQGDKIVQVYPQGMKLTLRLNDPITVKMTFSRSQDYPLDLYYLMDLSGSMSPHKDKLSALGQTLARAMMRITKDFKIGFGSFIDKKTLPYDNSMPLVETPSTTYSFRNHMSLDTDARRFEDEVRRAKIGGNIDIPEGGFDALMQAIVCHEEIGWRKQARRLIVFSTDADSHIAGDGKLGGIVMPNSGECKMQNHFHTHALIEDYPSVAHINAKVRENAINLIFAITRDAKSHYDEMVKYIEGSYVSRLEDSSSNVVQLIEEQYKKISSSIELKDNSTEFIKVDFSSKCFGTKVERTNKCDNIKVGDKIDFDIQITATSCSAETVRIYPVGIDESLVLDIQPICECPCMDPSHKTYERDSVECKQQGTLQCGLCDCNPGFTGLKCECAEGTDDKNNTNCDFIDCNNRGDCRCGLCECRPRPNPEEKYFGKNCECDNFSCERRNGLLCSGNGECTCDKGIVSCSCKEGWNGTACECSTSMETCKAPNDTQLCSGFGNCKCGKCECEQTEKNRRFGRFCEKCPNCGARCKEFRDCVQCQVYRSGPLAKNCTENCKNGFLLQKVNDLGDVKPDEEQLCSGYDDEQCRFDFIYNDRDESKIVVRSDERLHCPTRVKPFTIIISIVASILLVGVATLLLWKVIMIVQYRREFARFEEERKNAAWTAGQNPLYRDASTTVKNPAYRGSRAVK
ncbi:integrin beta-PS-like [Culicoides brevitarsis]|uniref:integrin beta-PS-like n=1 Tax=Culicoides brevitarsis TaxID=469753 RepID=UPI00307C30B8